MNKTSIFAGACMVLLACCSCNNDLVEYKKNDLKITLEKGESWLHDFPLFLGKRILLRLLYGWKTRTATIYLLFM